MKQPVERRLAAILAADVAGYSRLMGADEEGTHHRLKAHVRELIDPKIREHRGRIVKNTGDGMLIEFSSVVDAVRCAVEIQRGMVDRNAEIHEDKRITFRIGINLGDVIIDRGDIYGDGVNIAARLEALAEPGGICISRVVRDQIRDKLPYPFEDMGEQSVKNIARPVRAHAISAGAVAATPLVAPPAQPSQPRSRVSLRRAVIATSAVAVIGIAIAGWWLWPKGNPPTALVQAPAAASPQSAPAVVTTPAPRLSFIVLPFENLSRDPDQEYFADGITDDLTTDLSRISGSFVIARNTAFTYKGKPADVKQIGRELGVRYLIEGSVRRLGDQVQVNVQLIDAEAGAHLWADRFDTDRTNLTEAQNEITGRLAKTLNVELYQAASRRIERERATDPDARDLATRAWARVLRGPQSAATLQEALQYGERALEIDPGLVEAKLDIAGILDGRLTNGWSSSVEEDQARAEKLLQEVLEDDPNNPRAHISLGVLRRFQNRLGEARIELETGIALDRNNTAAFRNLGLTLMQMGKPEEAIPYVEKSIRLSPHDPNIVHNYASLGLCHLLLGHADPAVEFLIKARAANPRIWWAHFWLAGALGLRGDAEEARTALADALKLKPEVNSLARLRASLPSTIGPQYLALREKTLVVGLRRAGFPEE
jgi:TolB-like protein/class 3 adenylate cyclase/Tfp pilus assembly protein PilF